MKILVLGASGFIGSALALSLVDQGHEVLALGRNIERARRRLPALEWVEGDLQLMQAPGDWSEHLERAEVAINCAGALQSGLRDDVEAVQLGAMRALYRAAGEAGLGQFIQISAVGANAAAQNPFLASKGRADEELIASGLRYCVLRPGLVIGRNCYGGSELLRVAAAAPVEALPSRSGPIQTAALGDVIEAVCKALDDPRRAEGIVDLVEAKAQSLAAVVAAHREWLGFCAPRLHLAVPVGAVYAIAKAADLLGWLGWRSALRSNAIAALLDGIEGDASSGEKLLGRAPKSLRQSLGAIGPAGKADRWHARLAGLYPIALSSLIVLWLASGLLGLAMARPAAMVLIDSGFAPQTAKVLVVLGSIADLAIAGALMWRRLVSSALGASLILALVYLAGSVIWSNWLWLDPLGPMLKIVPILALTAISMAMAEER